MLEAFCNEIDLRRTTSSHQMLLESSQLHEMKDENTRIDLFMLKITYVWKYRNVAVYLDNLLDI